MRILKASKSLIFRKIHKEQNRFKPSFEKVSSQLNYNNLKLNKNYFKNSICGDFGCGSTGAGAFNLLNLGAKYVHLVDLDKFIIKPINNKLKKFSGKYEINITSIIHEIEEFIFKLPLIINNTYKPKSKIQIKLRLMT